MRLDRIECQTSGKSTRLSARLSWENCDREETLWYEWPSSFADDVVAAPASILVATLPLALVTGERRITMAPPVCAYLYDHLRNAAELFSARDVGYAELALDLERELASPAPSANRRSAVCLSGGVDSLAARLENHRSLSPDHPERVRDALYFFGLNTYDFEEGQPVPARLAWNREFAGRLRDHCQAIGMTLIPVATNIRSLYPDWPAWANVGEAAALAAGAHAMSGRIHSLTIAGGGAGAAGAEAGSEPSLDPLYSSYRLNVRSVHGTVNRLEKTKMLAGDPASLSVLRVCYTFDVPSPGTEAHNCGKCEKCLRTMLALLVHDALDRAPTFPVHSITPAMLEGLTLDPTAHRQVLLYHTIATLLRARGRGDLADAIEARLDHFRRRPQPSRSLLQRILRR
jgi:hypothetical protein